MTKDTLFLLKGSFMKGLDGPFYCPECIAIEGLLSYFPKLRDDLDVVYVDFQRPRPAIVEILGEENQGSPVIVLADPQRATSFGLPVKEYEGVCFINDEKAILVYLSLAYGVSKASQ